MVRPGSLWRLLPQVLVCVVALGVLPAAAPAAHWARAPRSAPATQAARSSARPLNTAVVDPGLFDGPNATVAFEHAHDAGANLVRLILWWSNVAPPGLNKPDGFVASDPADPSYRWGAFDRQVKLAVARGLEPIVSIVGAPEWAQETPPAEADSGGPYKPNPAALAQFAAAAAKRYSSSFQGLPRVRYWQVWNEPNLTLYLRPQLEGGNPVSPDVYRRMVNSFADAVHDVDPTNVVIAGGTSPFGVLKGPARGIAPLRFMRELLCMSNATPSRPTCTASIKFDAWAHHPYTSGGPTHHANQPDDVSLGDLPRMRAVLLAATRAGHVVSRKPVQFWVTEFSWDSRPPDKRGVPSGLEGRWVAEALYRMWLSGVSVVTWFRLNDDPWYVSYFQSGLYFSGRTIARDRPKPAFTAFRFPFVAYRQRGVAFVWGRTPWGKPGAVEIDQQALGGHAWRRAGILRADAHGIFSRRFSAVGSRWLRARLAGGGARSLPFSLVPSREDLKVNPFGA